MERLETAYQSLVIDLENKLTQNGMNLFFPEECLKKQFFRRKPIVLLVGPYSSGKTSFVEWFCGQSLRSCRIGPQPTTDRFLLVTKAHWESNAKETDIEIPGKAWIAEYPEFEGLLAFGSRFHEKFAVTEVQCDSLNEVMLVDTPGVLAGQGHQIDRGYDFPDVLKWFAERAGLIFLYFDVNQVSVSDEMKRTILALLPKHESQIRLILNKSDSVSSQDLIEVASALQRSLTPVLRTPEMPRLYKVSFTNAETKLKNAKIAVKDQNDLMYEINTLYRTFLFEKIGTLRGRVRKLQLYARIMQEIQVEIQNWWSFYLNIWYSRYESQFINQGLEALIIRVKRKFQFGPEFVITQREIEDMKAVLKSTGIPSFELIIEEDLKKLERFIMYDLPKAMEDARPRSKI